MQCLGEIETHSRGNQHYTRMLVVTQARITIYKSQKINGSLVCLSVFDSKTNIETTDCI